MYATLKRTGLMSIKRIMTVPGSPDVWVAMGGETIPAT